MAEVLLNVENLHTEFRTEGGVVKAVDDVSFQVRSGETFALVGESGCGKSVTALSIMGLIPNPPGEITSGKVEFEGVDLLKLRGREMRAIRGSKIGMIFQEPMSSLNPVLTIRSQLAEPLKIHMDFSDKAANDRAQELIDMVGIPDSKTRLKQYPHELSGGQRQRIMIAMAMACTPRLLIADEATTALDVTIQAQILDLMQDVTEQSNASLLIITHNLGIVARYADRVAVMYAGKLREVSDATDMYAQPQHPYTVGLLRSVPRLDAEKGAPLTPIAGEIPDLTDLPNGCAFNPRCQWAIDRCSIDQPELEYIAPGKQVACFEHETVALDA
jgi:oligopeptide/dipeptide ABC transporter ATP-binding protein